MRTNITDSSDYDILTESNDFRIEQKGGISNKPSACFPPIYESSETQIKKEEENNLIRSKEPLNKSLVSIQDIINIRRDDKPFISI